MDEAMEDVNGVPGGSGDPGDDDYGLSSSAPNSDGTSRNSRLARKAESSRQARLRHKQFVTDLQEQAAGLQARIRELEAHCTTGPGSATVALRELKEALKPEQVEQLQKWLVEAQGEDHVLARYERGAVQPPPGLAASAASEPIAISGSTAHWRGGAAHSRSPMESDEDSAAFPLSRSWDDIEGARSILNLNSPNGFHPLAGNPNSMPPPASFSLPTSSFMHRAPVHGSIMGAMSGVPPPSATTS